MAADGKSDEGLKGIILAFCCLILLVGFVSFVAWLSEHWAK